MSKRKLSEAEKKLLERKSKPTIMKPGTIMQQIVTIPVALLDELLTCIGRAVHPSIPYGAVQDLIQRTQQAVAPQLQPPAPEPPPTDEPGANG